MNAVALGRLPLLLPARHRPGLRGRPLAPRRVPRQPRRVGPGRPRLRHVHRLVPDRRRHLHGVHVHRGARDAVRRQRGRLLRGAVHDRGLPAHLPVPAAALVGLAPARLRHAGRLRAGPLRLQAARARGRGHRHPRDDALHRAAAGRHPGGARGDGHRRPTSDNWFVKDLPLFIAFAVLAAYTYSSRPAGAGADRVRQGHPDLRRDHRRGDLPAHPARRLGPHLRRRAATRSTRSTPTTPTRSRPATAPAKGIIPPPAAHWAYASLALGSALALFMYPHSVTGVLSHPKNRSVIRRNAALLPAYSFLLGLLALLGFVGDRGRRQGRQPAAGGAAAVRERVPAAGSPASRSRPSRSARWCRRRSCRSRPRTCGPATSTRRSSTPTRRRSRRRSRASWSRWW